MNRTARITARTLAAAGLLAVASFGGARLVASYGLDGPSDTHQLHQAIDQFQEGDLIAAELSASVLASRGQQPVDRAWLVVAAAREKRGHYASAVRAYKLFLADCDSRRLRKAILGRVQHCQTRIRSTVETSAPPERLTDRQRKQLAEVDDKTYTESSDHFVVRARNAELAKLVAEEAESSLQRICRSILPGQEYAHSVDIHVWPTRKEFLANANSAREWSGGGFSIETQSGEIIRRIDLTQLDSEGNFASTMLDRVLPHETCHLVTHEFFGDAGAPLFLNEGLAMLAESTVDNRRILLAGAALAGDAKIPLDKLVIYSPVDLKDKPSLFYAESHSLADFLQSRLTRDQFRDVLDHVKSGASVSEAIQRALYMPEDPEFFSKLAKSWEEHAIAQAQIVQALTASK